MKSIIVYTLIFFLTTGVVVNLNQLQNTLFTYKNVKFNYPSSWDIEKVDYSEMDSYQIICRDDRYNTAYIFSVSCFLNETNREELINRIISQLGIDEDYRDINMESSTESKYLGYNSINVGFNLELMDQRMYVKVSSFVVYGNCFVILKITYSQEDMNSKFSLMEKTIKFN